MLVNGTWVVDFYTAEAAKEPRRGLKHYYVADFPTLFDDGATWADSHTWAIPASLKANDPAKYKAALKVLAFINDHNIDWARTGHMAVRKSVLDSEEYANLPHRAEYAGTAAIARDTPPSEHYGAIQDVLNRELQAIWLTDKPVEDALARRARSRFRTCFGPLNRPGRRLGRFMPAEARASTKTTRSGAMDRWTRRRSERDWWPRPPLGLRLQLPAARPPSTSWRCGIADSFDRETIARELGWAAEHRL